MLGPRPLGEDGADVGGDGLELDRAVGQHELAGFDLGEVEDGVDDLQQVQPGHLDALQAGGLLVGHARAADQVGHADDGVERGADLVGHVGEELALDPHQPLGLEQGPAARLVGGLALADVGEAHHRADDLAVPVHRADGRGDGQRAAVGAPEQVVVVVHRFAAHQGGQHRAVFNRKGGAVGVVMVHGGMHLLADQAAVGVAQQLAGDPVDEGEAALGVHAVEAAGGALEDQPAVGLRFGQLGGALGDQLLQLVAVGIEFGVEADALGDVLEDHHHADHPALLLDLGGVVGDGKGAAVLAAEVFVGHVAGLAVLQGLVGRAGADGVGPAVGPAVVNEGVRWLTDEFGRLVAQQREGDRVDEGGAPLGVEAEDAFGDGFEQQPVVTPQPARLFEGGGGVLERLREVLLLLQVEDLQDAGHREGDHHGAAGAEDLHRHTDGSQKAFLVEPGRGGPGGLRHDQPAQHAVGREGGAGEQAIAPNGGEFMP